MFDTATVNLSQTAANFFDAKGLEAIAKTNTPISKLLTLYNDVDVANDTLTAFDAMFDDHVSTIGQNVKAHIAFAKNVVVPRLTGFTEDIRSNMEKAKLQSPETSITISYIEVPAIFDNKQIIKELEEFKGLPNSSGDVEDLDLSAFAIDELLPYMMSGDNAMDKDVLNFIGAVGKSEIERFVRFPNRISAAGIYNADSACSALALYLLYKGIGIKADLNVGLSSKGLAAISYELKFKYGMQAVSAMQYVKSSKETGRIFDLIDQNKLNASVFKDNFLAFSEAGGSVETLYGAIVSPKIFSLSIKDNNIQAMLSSKDKYEHNWNTYRYLKNGEMLGQRLSIFKVLLTDVFLSSLNENTEVEAEAIKDIPGYHKTVERLFEDYLQTIKVPDTEIGSDGFNDVLLYVVANIRFYFTSSYQLLYSMKSYMANDSKLDIREAALLAGMDYIADYISAQLALVR